MHSSKIVVSIVPYVLKKTIKISIEIMYLYKSLYLKIILAYDLMKTSSIFVKPTFILLVIYLIYFYARQLSFNLYGLLHI